MGGQNLQTRAGTILALWLETLGCDQFGPALTACTPRKRQRETFGGSISDVCFVVRSTQMQIPKRPCLQTPGFNSADREPEVL